MARTRKPCPGCGEICQYRPAAEVCGSCKSLIKQGRKCIDEQVAACENQRVLTKLPHSARSLPYIRNSTNERREFQNAFYTIVLAVSEPASNEVLRQLPEPYKTPMIVEKCDTGYHGGRECYMIEPTLLDAMQNLWYSSVAMVDGAYRRGVASGEQLIAQLAGGDITIAQFEERYELYTGP